MQTGACKHFLTQFRLQSEIMRPCVVTKKYAKEICMMYVIFSLNTFKTFNILDLFDSIDDAIAEF